ncbi:MAG: CopG family transcriptional regulator [candidate division Zixibacteria bacterium]|nr:CopG family transcriptional regulator [candidate division Zixibacteria bacterium]MDH3938233.1 CopG family transcriptional regulator [candidate division Zixibacteria bacterium]MDH4033294.1 CopG family transcriptional regulator [candidate division Zixibacteria bacterium]
MATTGKSEMISFKVDESLRKAMSGIPNRSSFIRNAVIAALESSCPLCKGTGVLSAQQKKHWDTFAEDHTVRECRQCHEFHLVCAKQPRRKSAHRVTRSKRSSVGG